MKNAGHHRDVGAVKNVLDVRGTHVVMWVDVRSVSVYGPGITYTQRRHRRLALPLLWHFYGLVGEGSKLDGRVTRGDYHGATVDRCVHRSAGYPQC
jgi:hypothetical protein